MDNTVLRESFHFGKGLYPQERRLLYKLLDSQTRSGILGFQVAEYRVGCAEGDRRLRRGAGWVSSTYEVNGRDLPLSSKLQRIFVA